MLAKPSYRHGWWVAGLCHLTGLAMTTVGGALITRDDFAWLGALMTLFGVVQHASGMLWVWRPTAAGTGDRS